MQRFDAIIVGAGQAGPPLAGRLTAAGMTVALIERHLFGGTCVNTGCKPTKTLVASAYAAHLARRGADFGVETGPVRVDMARVQTSSESAAFDVPWKLCPPPLTTSRSRWARAKSTAATTSAVRRAATA